MSIFIIYKTTNLVNGKIYVGQHFTSADDGYLGSGKIIKQAIKKYGRKFFERETLEFCNLNEVEEKETFWIKKLNSIHPKIGYNISLGGLGPKLYGKRNGNYGNKWTDKQKKKASDRMIGRYDGENNPNYGNKWSEELRQQASKNMKGRESWCKGLDISDNRIKSISEKRKKTISKIPNFQKKKNHPRYDSTYDEKMIEMYNFGLTINEISKKLKLNRHLISRHLKFNEINMRRK